MGIPKFFGWISDRYPLLNQLVTADEIPPFDNLYLDVNGIIHQCSHPNEREIALIPDEQLFPAITAYIDFIFTLIRPRRVFFIAIDGVAPRAKLNQQRGRRFRAAKDLEATRRVYVKANKIFEDSEVFDSNCITPGTAFMDRLHKYLCHAIAVKVSSDYAWQKVHVYYSGHLVPGEGEHKIMDFIRYLAVQPDYDPETSHCMYGLDSDLFYLSLSTHQHNFCLLREEVKFGKNAKRFSDPTKINWHMCHISLLRDFIDLEFQSVAPSLRGFAYDIEKIIDDWVLLGFLIGNDFLPTIPGLYVGDGTLHRLWSFYREFITDSDGYLSEDGRLQPDRFLRFLTRLSDLDIEYFEQQNSEYDWMGESKLPCYNRDMRARLEQDDFTPCWSEGSDQSGWTEDIAAEFRMSRKRYYREKLKFTDDIQVQALCAEYIRGLQWNLHYYYRGCPSWTWYFPYHYSPYLSDLAKVDAGSIDLTFSLGSPFSPLEQLMAVLPPASAALLPKPLQEIVTNPNSPLAEFYPLDFETDQNGKISDFEAVVLIKFIEEKRLLAVVEQVASQLTEEESLRNRFETCLVFYYVPAQQDSAEAPFPWLNRLDPNHAAVITLPGDCFAVRAAPDAKRRADSGNPAFARLKNRNLTVGWQAQKSRRHALFPSKQMILTVRDETSSSGPLAQVLMRLLNRRIYVNWPFLKLAKVTAIIRGDVAYTVKSRHAMEIRLGKQEMNAVRSTRIDTEKSFGTKGLRFSGSNVIIEFVRCVGMRQFFSSNNQLREEEVFSTESQYTIPELILAPPVGQVKYPLYRPLTETLSVGALVVCVHRKRYGRLAKVNKLLGGGRVLLDVRSRTPLRLPKVSTNDTEDDLYTAASIGAWRYRLPAKMVASLSGRLAFRKGDETIYVGYDWKSNQKQMRANGYTLYRDQQWLYSDRAYVAISRVRDAYPTFFAKVTASAQLNQGPIDAYSLFPDNATASEELLEDVKLFIERSPDYKVSKVGFADTRLPDDVIAAVQSEVLKPDQCVTYKRTQEQLRYVYPVHFNSTLRLSASFEQTRLMDEVVHSGRLGPTSCGVRGVVVGLKGDKTIEVLFEAPLPGAYSIVGNDETPKLCKCVSPGDIFNVTFHDSRSATQASLPAKSSGRSSKPGSRVASRETVENTEFLKRPLSSQVDPAAAHEPSPRPQLMQRDSNAPLLCGFRPGAIIGTLKPDTAAAGMSEQLVGTVQHCPPGNRSIDSFPSASASMLEGFRSWLNENWPAENGSGPVTVSHGIDQRGSAVICTLSIRARDGGEVLLFSGISSLSAQEALALALSEAYSELSTQWGLMVRRGFYTPTRAPPAANFGNVGQRAAPTQVWTQTLASAAIANGWSLPEYSSVDLAPGIVVCVCAVGTAAGQNMRYFCGHPSTSLVGAVELASFAALTALTNSGQDAPFVPFLADWRTLNEAFSAMSLGRPGQQDPNRTDQTTDAHSR